VKDDLASVLDAVVPEGRGTGRPGRSRPDPRVVSARTSATRGEGASLG